MASFTIGGNWDFTGSMQFGAYTAGFAQFDSSGNITSSTAIYLANTNTGLGLDVFSALSSFGTDNVAVGYYAMHATVGGTDNVAIGALSLLANTSGSGNASVGYGAMANNTSGSYNVALGYEALLNNVTANDNIAIGYSAMYLSTTGAENCAMGAGSLQTLGSGNNNVAIGTISLENVISGDSNVAVGYGAGGGYTSSETGNICIGANVTGSSGESNAVRIGIIGTASSLYIGGLASQTAATAAAITTTAPSTVQPSGWATVIYNTTTGQWGYYTQV